MEIQEPAELSDKPKEDEAAVSASIEKKSQAKLQVLKPVLSQYESFLIPMLILFMLGNVLAYAWPHLLFAKPNLGGALIALLVGLIIYSAGQGLQNRWKIRTALWAIACISGSIYYYEFHFMPGPHDIKVLAPLERAEVIGNVETLSGKHQAIVQVQSVNGQPANGKLLATLPDDVVSSTQAPALQSGTRLLLTGDLRQPFHSQIPGAFDHEKYLGGQQITALLKHPDRLVIFETSNEPRFILQRLTDYLKTRIATTFSRYLPSPQAEVLGGIVLGDKAIPVDRETRQAFIQTGLVHILAASGLNVGIIAAAVLWLLSRLRVGGQLRLLVAMGAVLFYSLLTGLPPSIQRATVMLEIALMLKLLDRTFSPTMLLCVSGTVLVLLHPNNVGNIGFQFSMLTTFGLMTMVPPLQEWMGYYVTRWLAGLILVPLVAQLWIWPLSVYYFNQFPIHSVPLNLLAILLVTPLTVIGFSTATISVFLPQFGGWLSWLAMPFLNGLLMLVKWGNSLTWAKWTLSSPTPWLLMLFYGQLFVILGLMYRLKKTLLSRKLLIALLPLFLIVGTLCLEKGTAQSETQIDLLPLSFRHEGYLIKPAQQAQVVAILPANLNYFETRALLDYLKHRQIFRFKALILLPETQTESFGTESDLDGLNRLFKTIHFQTLITTPELASQISMGKSFHPILALREGKAHLGTLSIETIFPNLRVLSRQSCLLEIQQHYRSNSNCAIQEVSEESGRLSIFPFSHVGTEQYHRLIYQDNKALVYNQ